ncbi:hypothetical protein P7J56_09840, partial [Streptococcus suis]
KKAFLFCPDGVVSALKQPFFSKNSKKTNTKTMFVCNLKHWRLPVFWGYFLLQLASYAVSKLGNWFNLQFSSVLVTF